MYYAHTHTHTHTHTHVHTHRVKDLENREETHKPLRAKKHKRKYYPRKVLSPAELLKITG